MASEFACLETFESVSDDRKQRLVGSAVGAEVGHRPLLKGNVVNSDRALFLPLHRIEMVGAAWSGLIFDVDNDFVIQSWTLMTSYFPHLHTPLVPQPQSLLHLDGGLTSVCG